MQNIGSDGGKLDQVETLLCIKQSVAPAPSAVTHPPSPVTNFEGIMANISKHTTTPRPAPTQPLADICKHGHKVSFLLSSSLCRKTKKFFAETLNFALASSRGNNYRHGFVQKLPEKYGNEFLLDEGSKL